MQGGNCRGSRGGCLRTITMRLREVKMEHRSDLSTDIYIRLREQCDAQHAALAQAFSLASSSPANQEDRERLRGCAKILLRAHARVRYLSTPAESQGRYYLQTLHDQLTQDFSPCGGESSATWLLGALTRLDKGEVSVDECVTWVALAARAAGRLLKAAHLDELVPSPSIFRTAGRVREILSAALADLEQHMTGTPASDTTTKLPVARTSARPHRSEPLTSRETRVAYLVAEGFSNREVAQQLSVAPKTVEVHLANIFRKLGVSRRTELRSRLVAAYT
ncbi:response regulator transcription factor [Streptomyces sp. NPDC002659]|uniref:helix-turn-helix transcriptional regulator n=1 Tax=Streptomyces sp. NPDC002659 TaxID=3364656 RepID=UPI0036AA2E3F